MEKAAEFQGEIKTPEKRHGAIKLNGKNAYLWRTSPKDASPKEPVRIPIIRRGGEEVDEQEGFFSALRWETKVASPLDCDGPPQEKGIMINTRKMKEKKRKRDCRSNAAKRKFFKLRRKEKWSEPALNGNSPVWV